MRHITTTALRATVLSLMILGSATLLATAQGTDPTSVEAQGVEDISSDGRQPDLDQTVDSLISQAETADADKDYVLSESLWRRVLALAPDSAIAHYSLGNTILSQDAPYRRPRWVEAEVAFREAIHLDSSQPEFHFVLIMVLIEQQRFEEIPEIVLEAALVDPENKDYYYKTLAYAISSQSESAESHVANLRSAIETYGPLPSFYTELGTFYSRENLLAEAEATYREGIQKNPTETEFYSRLGYILTSQERYEEAIPFHQEEVRLDPKKPYPYRNLGNALKNADRLLEAEAVYREGVAKSLDDDRYAFFSYKVLADFLNEQQRYEEAESIYRAGTQRSEPAVGAFIALQRFLEEQGRTDEAEALDEITDCVRQKGFQRRYRPDETPVIVCDTTIAL